MAGKSLALWFQSPAGTAEKEAGSIVPMGLFYFSRDFPALKHARVMPGYFLRAFASLHLK
jgi:hypothetical protein